MLLYTGYKLATPRLFIAQFRAGPQQYVPFLTTVVGIIAFGMLVGIALGLVMQVVLSIYHSHRNALQLARFDDHYVLRIHQNLTFCTTRVCRRCWRRSGAQRGDCRA